MGGLAASQYVASDIYGEDVDQILYLGTPLAGAPLAYKTWESGEVDFGDELQNFVMQRVFEREARDMDFNTVLDYVQSGLVPSVQELLPIYTYLGTPPTTLPYPAGHPQNTFLENLLTNFGEVFGGARLHAIIGNTGEASTTSAFIVQPSTQLPKWEHGEPVATQFERGDGTVPEYSAIYMFPAEKEFLNTNHTQLPSVGAGYSFEVLNYREPEIVIEKLYDYKAIDYGILIKKISPSSGDFRVLIETLVDILPFSQTTTTASKILLILLFSPIDVEITAPDGKRIGKDIVTGATLNEIPDALYSGPDAEHEYVIILDPLPGEYKVKTLGTGSGSYTIAAGYGDSATTSELLVNGTTTVNQIIENTLTVSSTSTTVMIEEDIPPPPAEEITPQTCVEDIQLAYTNSWIKKKKVYNALIADCKRLGVLFVARDKAKNDFIQKGVTTTIKLTLNHMDKLAKDKGNTEEAVELITKNTTWFREHEIK
jgi:hypothetical protein